MLIFRHSAKYAYHQNWFPWSVLYRIPDYIHDIDPPNKRPMNPPIESVRIYDNFLKPHHLEEVRSSFQRNGFGTWEPKAKGVLNRNAFQGCGYVGRNDIVFSAIHARLGRPVYPQETKARNTPEGEESDRSHIHSDRSMGSITAILFLTPKPDPSSGTQFYRYKPNPGFERLEAGLEFMPPYEEMIAPDQQIVEGKDIKLKGWGEELKRDMEGDDPVNPTKFAKSFFAHEETNRMIIFPASLFHCRLPVDGAGVDEETDRLIWVSHCSLTPYNEMP